MPPLSRIQQLLPDLVARADDPPAKDSVQAKVKHVLESQFGQSTSYLEPYFFSSGRLVIFVTAPIWATHIRHRKNTLFEQLREQHIIAKEISVKVLPNQEDPEKPPVTPSVTALTLDRLERTAEQLKKPELRDAVQRLHARLSQQTPTDSTD